MIEHLTTDQKVGDSSSSRRTAREPCRRTPAGHQNPDCQRSGFLHFRRFGRASPATHSRSSRRRECDWIRFGAFGAARRGASRCAISTAQWSCTPRSVSLWSVTTARSPRSAWGDRRRSWPSDRTCARSARRCNPKKRSTFASRAVDRLWAVVGRLGFVVGRPIEDGIGLRDFTVLDPDGFGLRFATPLRVQSEK